MPPFRQSENVIVL